MKSISLFFSILALTATPAIASSAMIQLVAVEPVSCAIGLVGAQIVDHRVRIDVRRNCNTAHTIVIAGPIEAAVGNVTMRYNGVLVDMKAGSATVNEPERYYDGIDHITLNVTSGTTDEVREYVSGLNIGIAPA